MKSNRNLILMSALVLVAGMVPSEKCHAQGLPPTNMGKFVHQPGDNQYSVNTQLERHGTSYIDTMGTGSVIVGPAGQRVGVGGPVGAPPPPAYIYAPPPPKGPDISIEPITADEPIPLPGFPPMPMALDLPVSLGYASAGSNPSGWLRNGGGGGGGGGGSNGYQGSHQHYGHYEPGAFKKNNGGGGGGGGGWGGDNGGGGGGGDYGGGGGGGYNGGGGGGGGNNGGGGGGNNPGMGNYGAPPVQKSGYRVGTPPPITRGGGDVYSANTGTTGKGAVSVPLPGRTDSAGGGGPAYAGVSGKDIKALGKAPELDKEEMGGPEAPSPVLVNQSRSQDLSLPDDEFVSGNFKNDKSKRFVKNAAKRGKQFGKQMLRQTGLPISF